MNSRKTKINQSYTFTLGCPTKWVYMPSSAMIVRITSRYEGDIWVTKDDERINAKSIMGIMMLAAAKGTELKFETNSQKRRISKRMTELFTAKFQDE